MNWDMGELIFVGAATWIGAGLCAGGLALASLQHMFAKNAADNYSRRVLIFWVMVALGPFGLLGVVGNMVSGEWEYYGMLFPSRKARKYAGELQRMARGQ